MEHFDSIEPLIVRIKADLPRNPLGTEEGRDEYEWIDYGDDDGGRIMASLNSPFISPFLYRGQTRRYSPCFPTLYRDFPVANNPRELPPVKRDAYLLAQVRLLEFLSVLNQHPAIELAREIGLHLNQTAIAQHYGIPTDHIDLTQDHEVALFFASCKPNDAGEWHPVSEGIGVLYRFDMTVFSRVLGSEVDDKISRVLEMIGLQTLPRPGEQKAWTLKLPLGFDFERLPLDVFTFSQVPDAAQPLADKFVNGRVLFPPDVLADMCTMIRSATSVPRILGERVFLQHGCNPNLIDDALQTYSRRFADGFGITISDRAPISMTPDQKKLTESFVRERKDGFLKKVGVRLVLPVKRNHNEQDPTQQEDPGYGSQGHRT